MVKSKLKKSWFITCYFRGCKSRICPLIHQQTDGKVNFI